MGVDNEHFESLLDQIRDLHRVTDEITRSPRLHQYVRARLRGDREVVSLPMEQRRVAEEAVRALTTPRLSSAQSRELYRVFFDR